MTGCVRRMDNALCTRNIAWVSVFRPVGIVRLIGFTIMLSELRPEKELYMLYCSTILLSTRSSTTAEIARVSGHYAVQGHSRSLVLLLS